jgi:hypothetical protein
VALLDRRQTLNRTQGYWYGIHTPFCLAKESRRCGFQKDC